MSAWIRARYACTVALIRHMARLQTALAVYVAAPCRPSAWRVQVHLIAACKRRGIPVLCIGGAGAKADPTKCAPLSARCNEH